MKVKNIRTIIPLFIFLTLLLFHVASHAQMNIPEPESFFGYKPGTDRMLFTYEKLIEYLQNVDNASPRVKLVEIGESPLGKKIYISFISAERNINNLDKLRTINEKLALNPKLTSNEQQKLLTEGKVFVLATLSMHSGEVGPSQSAPIIAYDLATTTDPDKLLWLDNVVYMMVPCHNPDGMNMVVNHYNKYKGTKYEGSSLPGVYHKYVGHDNNRDFVILSQKDTKAIAAIYNKTWFPQVMVEKHQMGSTGPRYFVPPNHDPIAENVEAGIWNWTGVFGSNLIKYMTAQGLTGISQHYLFDDYWPGSTETCIWKNVIGFLTEAASSRYAKPIYIEPNELRVYGKGLSEYKKSINMPSPWPGGWWRLGDIVEYEIQSTYSIIETASLYKDEILQFRNDICKREVEKGQTQAPYYYILPVEQHDRSELVGLVQLLIEHGVQVFKLADHIQVEGKQFNKNDIVVPLAQAFRPFIKEVLETQEFPVRHYTPGGKIIKPYDITSWSLPLHRGVAAFEMQSRSEDIEKSLLPVDETYNLNTNKEDSYQAVIFPSNVNESYKVSFWAMGNGVEVGRTKREIDINGTVLPAGSFVIEDDSKSFRDVINALSVSPIYLKAKNNLPVQKLKSSRIALVETYFHDMDAGWTRFIFDQYQISYKVLRPGDFEDTDLAGKFDVIVFPDVDKSILMEGKYKSKDDYYISSYPPEYTKGIGKDGMKKLMTYLDKGGIIISWGRSANLFKGSLSIPLGKEKSENFQLPFSDVSEGLQKKGLYCPGSLVGIELIQDHPLTLGLPSTIGVFYRGRPVFTTSVPKFDMDRRVIAKFPEKNILKSGYCEKEETIGNKSAMIWLKKGRGQLVLFAFGPQFRASTQVSYKLLFNSLLLANQK